MSSEYCLIHNGGRKRENCPSQNICRYLHFNDYTSRNAGIREVEKWQLRSDVHFSMLRGGTSCGVSGYSETARAALSITFATSLGCEM
jgi:hypothetical protein